jgi:GalNAc-alpha-(1->4)-GalNAc-alpha-(1->3)-diNAcBac-PP-undecaprenol alpha-1,4-N-acetyl-D-galactosaminyltransferase
MKIMLVIQSMVAGGAERVAATLINHWVDAADDLTVTLVTVASPETDFYEVDSRVARVALGLSCPTRSWRHFMVKNVQIVRQLRQLMRRIKPDVVLSMLDYVNVRVLLAAFGTRIPVIVEEHMDPTQTSTDKTVRILRWLLYRRATAVVVLTSGIAQWASRIVATNTIHVIPNPISDQFLKTSSRLATPYGHKIIGMGRLEFTKGFDLLLRAFAKCAEHYPDWTLDIFGEGSEHDRLTALADNLGIADKVRLPGTTKHPEEVLRKADVFVLSSRYEGFPMVLLEAMTCGLPVVSFDCRSGPREMIDDGVNGLLVPPNDVDALAEAMAALMGDEDERKRLGEWATAVAEKFSLARVTQMWRSVFDQAVSGRHNLGQKPTVSFS